MIKKLIFQYIKFQLNAQEDWWQAENMEGATIKEHHGKGGDGPPEYYDVTHHDIPKGKSINQPTVKTYG